MWTFDKCANEEFIVKPRWPSNHVHISDETYARLKEAQTKLQSHDIKLVLTRGYEKERVVFMYLHKLGRKVGATIFCILYPKRIHEVKSIFSTNGHESSGNCIDVSIIHKRNLLRLLPRGVLTSKSAIKSIQQINDHVLRRTYDALKSAGFLIHPNPTEAMQIHCELDRR
jgi:hypothetical protein